MKIFIHSILFGKKPRDVKGVLPGKKYIFSRLCLAFLLLLFFSINGNSQVRYDTANWRFSNPKQFGFTVLDVDFFDNTNVIAVGQDGGIARSVDGGANWSYGVFTFINARGLWFKPTFTDVHYITSNIAYAVGSGITGSASSPFIGGVMIKTTDGGATWSQVNNPLNANLKNINTCWFLNKDTGYVAGQWNTPDSIPKVYYTRNGGATWDSLVTPSVSGTTKLGFINNATYPGIDYPIDGKAKEIWRIVFLNSSVGYVSGGGSPLFPTLPIPNITNTTTCAFAGTQTTGSHNASLLWKFDNGTLYDYSISKERLGYTGYPAAPLNCSSKFGTVTATTQQYRALSIINDSLIVMMSFNNNIVIRVRTGKNDSTQNINRPGVYEKGRYEILNTGNAGPPPGYPSIPTVQVLNASNPYQMLKASNGTLYVNGSFGRLWTSVDNGSNWVQQNCFPAGTNFSTFNVPAMDIAPGGKFLVAGTSGVVADSIPGGRWSSTYVSVLTSADRVEFADCNNGMTAGSGGNITVTTDGGKTWVNKTNAGIGGGGYTLFGMAYPTTSKAYFAVNNGIIYSSTDQGTTLDPAYSNFNYQMRDVAAIGNDTVWAVGNNITSIPIASRTSSVFRSVNGGLNWTIHGNFPVGVSSALNLNQVFTDIEFPSRQVGYVAGNKDTIWKSTDAGATWFKLPLPTPGVLPQISYNDMFALDDNTVFLVGIGFGATTRTVVFKTIDGGNTWTDISGNIGLLMGAAIGGASNNTTVMFHDANNGYVSSGSGSLLKTTDGGISWTLDYAPSGGFGAMAFAPRKVPPSISFANRKLFLVSLAAGGAAPIMEYGNPANVNVNTAETVINASCTNTTAGSITVNTSGGIAPYTYSINGGAFQSSNVFNGLTQGPKTITIKDSYCGTLTKTVNVGFTDNMTVTANNDTTVCTGTTVQMTAAAPAGSTFAWAPSAGLSNTAIANPVATINNNTTYTVTATLGGCVKTDNVVITTKPSPTISAGPDKTIVDGDKVQLQGSANNAVSVAWTPANTLTDANTFFPTAKPTVTTTYTLTVINNNNCTSTDNAIVNVIPYCIKVMNAFTPNGDGTNDRWIVTNGSACTNLVKVRIFNRYGQEVYKNENYQNNWDGMYGGKPIPDGTYYYTIDFRLIGGKSVIVKGDVTILR